MSCCQLGYTHRKRIELEDKAKVIALDWVTESMPRLVELNHLYQKDRGKTASAARGTVELNHLFQIDRGKTASLARILSPNLIQRPLPCLLIKSFFYAVYSSMGSVLQSMGTTETGNS